MTKREAQRETTEAAAIRLAAAVMQRDLTLTEFWALLNDPARAVDTILKKAT